MKQSVRNPLAGKLDDNPTTLDKVEEVCEMNGAVIFKPLTSDFAKGLMNGTKQALPVELFQVVPGALACVLDKPTFFDGLTQCQMISRYLPNILHVGARSFIVNVVNSLSRGALRAMLVQLAEMVDACSNVARKNLQDCFPWTSPRKTVPLPQPVQKRGKKSIILKPKPVQPQELDNARGLCSRILQKFASTPQTRVACRMTACRVYDDVVELEFDLDCTYKFTAISDSASVHDAKMIRDANLLQSLYSD